MKPLKLTWRLVSPIVVSAYPLHLDALVAFATAEEGKQQDLAAWDMNATLELPFERAVKGGLECWKASALQAVEPGEHSMRFWTRKSDPYDYAARLEAGQLDVKTKIPLKSYGIKFDQVRGQFKQMYKWLPVRSVQHLQAWCIGDEDRINELLAPAAGYITYLGPKTRMGYGRVAEFTCEVDVSARENWMKRVLPWHEEGFVQVEAATQPPYWDIENRRAAWLHPDIYN